MKPFCAIFVVSTALIIPYFWLDAAIDPGLLPRFLLLASILLLSVGVLAAFVIRNRDTFDFSILRRGMSYILLGSVIVAGISLTGAVNLAEGIFDLLRLSLFIILILTAELILSNVPDCSDLVTRMFVIAGISLAVIGVLQYFRIAFIFWEGRPLPYGTITNKNLYTSSLYLTIPFIWYKASGSRGVWRWLSAAGLMCIGYVIVLARTRAVWLALPAAIFSTSVILLFLIKKNNLSTDILRRVFRLLSAGAMMLSIGIALGFLTVSISGYNFPSNSEKRMTVTDPRSLKERLILWDRSLQMVSDHPVLGVGGGNWKIVFPSYGMNDLRGETGDVFFQRPHNDFIWVLAENGPLGLALYLSIFLAAIYYCCLTFWKASTDSSRILSVMLIFGLTGFLVISFFGFPRERIIHLTYLSILLSLAIVSYNRLFPISKSVKKPLMASFAIIAFLCIIASLYIGSVRLNADIHTKQAMAAGLANDWDTVIAEIDKADCPLAGLDPTATPRIWYKGYAQLNLNNVDGAFDSFQKAFHENPFHVKVLDNLATCYELKGEHMSAIDYYRRALEILPGSENISLNLAAAYYNAGLYKEARTALLHIKGKPADSRYKKFMEQVEKQLNRYQNEDSEGK